MQSFPYKMTDMKNIPKKYHWIDIGDDARRQFIDSQGVFTAWESARNDAAQVRGGMYWKQQGGRDYLIRTSPKNSQKSLGRRSEETVRIYERFVTRKAEAERRLSDLATELSRQQRMNRALFVGRAPRLLVDILARLAASGLAKHFTVVGTHALYAYEAAAGVRFGEVAALATRDIDLFWDTRRRLSFVAHMDTLGSSMLGLLRKVDPTFELRPFQRHTAVNSKGFEIDILRREAKDKDPHPLSLTDDEDEFSAVQAKNAETLLSGPRFSSMIVATSGHMARMETISPQAFVKFKRWLADQADRDPLRRKRDDLQADLVEELVLEYLPHIT